MPQVTYAVGDVVRVTAHDSWQLVNRLAVVVSLGYAQHVGVSILGDAYSIMFLPLDTVTMLLPCDPALRALLAEANH